MTFIKICGITSLEDALCAVEAGANALGFNFYRPSVRYVEPSKARLIVKELPPGVMSVGVFVNEPTPSAVRAIASEVGLKGVQLHGDESPEFCEELKDFYVIKALAVGADFAVAKALEFKVAAILLDASHKKLRGGTGQTIDWSIARKVNESGVNLFLAGGLSPENVCDAIETVRPYAVDACSGLEREPGIKDMERVRSFVERIRALNQVLSQCQKSS